MGAIEGGSRKRRRKPVSMLHMLTGNCPGSAPPATKPPQICCLRQAAPQAAAPPSAGNLHTTRGSSQLASTRLRRDPSATCPLTAFAVLPDVVCSYLPSPPVTGRTAGLLRRHAVLRLRPFPAREARPCLLRRHGLAEAPTTPRRSTWAGGSGSEGPGLCRRVRGADPWCVFGVAPARAGCQLGRLRR